MIKLLFLSLAGSLLALFLMLLRRKTASRISSAFFYWAWLLVLLRFALPVQGLVPLYERQPEPEYTVRENYVPRQEVYLPEVEKTSEDINFEKLPVAEETKPAAKKSFDFEKLMRWELLWLGGAALVILKQSIGYMAFSKKLRRTLAPVSDFELWQYMSIKQRAKPELAKSEAVSTPMLLGLKNPLLVLPERDYSFDDFNNILLHEFTHYRRGDVWLKWAAMFIFAFHWFNPLCCLFIKELDKVCELSCDEKLLKNMDKQQKQSYGETLLELAAVKGAKKSSLSTCLAEEKHVLKERLEQIMKYKNKGKGSIVAMILSLAVLAGCTVAAGPDTTPKATSEPTIAPVVNDENGVIVHTVDELLDAIEPGANIVLTEGTFNLAEAKNYGIDSEHYAWAEMGDGYELQILKADGLSISGAGIGKSSIITDPRSVDVLNFSGGQDIKLAGFTAGHTEQAGPCQGDVISFDGVRNAVIDSCELFGCGYMGVVMRNSKNVLVENSVIRECSGRAVYPYNSHYVQVDNCEIYSCAEFGSLVGVQNSTNIVFSNNLVHNNNCVDLFSGSNNQKIKLLGNKFYDNDVQYIFFLGNDVLVEGCSFEDKVDSWYSDDVIVYADGSTSGSVPRAIDAQGNILEGEDLAKMEHRYIDFSFGDEVSAKQNSEFREISVKTEDEFLAAIAPNTRIILDGESFDLSSASNYGLAGNDWYFWAKCYDGYELVLQNLENFSIAGQGKAKTTISATPRYANVLSFLNCREIELSAFTAGHTEEPGMCVGGVLKLVNSDDIYIQGCGLFGCGTIGIDASSCKGLTVTDTEIYDCSLAGLSMVGCREVVFENCDIHDMSDYAIVLGAETSINFNGAVMDKGIYYLENGEFVTRRPEANTKPEVQIYEPVPTPELGEFRIWFGQFPIETDCTMRVGEEPIRFFAGRSSVDVTEEAVTWTVSDPEAIELDYDDLGYFCGVKVINPIKGGVELTATRGDESATITIYCLP